MDRYDRVGISLVPRPSLKLEGGLGTRLVDIRMDGGRNLGISGKYLC